MTDVLGFLLFLLSLPSFKKFISPFLLLMILFLSVGIFLSINPLAGWWELVKLCEYIFVGWYIATHAEQTKRFLLPAFAVGILFEGFLAFAQFFLHHSVGGILYFFGERFFSSSTPGIANASIRGSLVLRPYGTFPHPNVLAGYMLIASLFMLWRSALKEGNRLISGGLFLFASSVIFLSLSRLVFIAWILGLFVFSVKNKPAQIKVGLLALVAIGITLLLFPLFQERLFSALFTDEAFLLRLKLFQAALSMMIAFPLFGVGINNFLSMLPFFLPQVSFSSLQPVHNVYVLAGAQVGFIGLGGFVLFLFSSLSKAARKYDRWVLASLIAICFVGLGDHYFVTIQQGQLLFSLILGLAWAKK